MAGNSSYETSWADQWDYSNPEPAAENKKSGGGGGDAVTKYRKKVGEGLEKTKGAASTGMKKVRAGTSLGIQWVKDKYHKTTHKR